MSYFRSYYYAGGFEGVAAPAFPESWFNVDYLTFSTNLANWAFFSPLELAAASIMEADLDGDDYIFAVCVNRYYFLNLSF